MKKGLLATLLILVVVALVAKFFIVELPSVSGNDMAPTLQVGDRVLVYRLNTRPARGDLVLVEHPQVRGRLLIRRVVGLPGETIGVLREVPQLDRRPVRRGVMRSVTLADAGSTIGMRLLWETWPTKTIFVLKDPRRRSVDAPSIKLTDAYYVLADNRNHGTDSRTFGPVPASHVRGVVTHTLGLGQGTLQGGPERRGWSRL